MISKTNNFVIRLLDRAHLDTGKILNTYIAALIIIPLFFAGFVAYEASLTAQSLAAILTATPIIAVDMIMMIINFIFGYYLWLSKEKILTDLPTYRFFMLCQAIGQVMAGNFICVLLAMGGLVRTNGINQKEQSNNKLIRGASVIFLLIFGLCLILTIWLSSKK